jgi:hypothetical protein
MWEATKLLPNPPPGWLWWPSLAPTTWSGPTTHYITASRALWVFGRHKQVKVVQKSVNTKFLGLQIGNHLNWKNHIDQCVPKFSGACYAVRSMSRISNTDTLKSIYFAYFHFIMKYGTIFWGNSCNNRNYLHLKRKTLELWPVSNLEIQVGVCLWY